MIELTNDGSGLGFGISGNKSTGVVVKAIVPGSIVDKVKEMDEGCARLHFIFTSQFPSSCFSNRSNKRHSTESRAKQKRDRKETKMMIDERTKTKRKVLLREREKKKINLLNE